MVYSTSMRFHFVVNPVAGRARAVPLVEAMSEGLRGLGHDASTHVTLAAGDAAAHVRDLEADTLDRLIVVGGDGTLREVVNSRPPPLPWPVGVVPMGTANLVGRELRMPLHGTPDELVARLSSARNWVVDLLRFENGEGQGLAVANVGAGLDAEIVHAAALVRSDDLGGYGKWVAPIWRSLATFRFPPLRVTVDGRRTFNAGACVVQNARNYGGLFELSPDAALDSGRLEVTLLRARSHRDLFRVMTGAFLRRASRFKDVRVVSGQGVEIAADEAVPLQADGDPAGRAPVAVDLIAKSLVLLRAPA